ncbi:hypothetical protein Tco_0511454 [Tanacetum coccineum]
MASSITRFDIEKLDGNIIQNHGGSKQVGFKQLGHKQVGFKQLGTIFETGFHGVLVMYVRAQRQLEDKQLEERTNTDNLVKEQEKVHLGIKVRADITITGVPGQEGPEGNVAGRKKWRSKEAKLGNLLKYKAWLTRRSPSPNHHSPSFECSPSSSISTIKSLSSFLDEWKFRGLPTWILVHVMWGYWDGDVFVCGCRGQRVKVCSFDRNGHSTCMVVSHGWSCGVNGIRKMAISVPEVEIYVPEWTVTKGFELNDGRLCANMIDHFTPPAFFKTVRGMEHEQLFTEFNVSAARNLSLSSEVRMRAEYNILEKRKWRSLAEEKNILLEAKDKEIEDLKSQLLKANEESAEVAQLRSQVSGLETTESSLRGEVASTKDHNVLLKQECNSLKLKVTGLESTIAEKDHELSDLGASSSSLKSKQDLVHELEISSADLRKKLEMYEGILKQLEEFQDNLLEPSGLGWPRLMLDITCCLNSNEYMEALGHAFGRAIEKGMQEGLAAGIEHGQADRCLTDLEAYIPSAEDDFNSAIRDLSFPLLQELSDKKDAITWDIMDLLRLDDAVAETLGMTDLQPDVSQLMVPVHHKQDRVVIGSQALSVALDICRGLVEKIERNLIERLPFLKDVFVSIDDPLSAEALIELPAEVPSTNVLSTVVIVPSTDPSISVEDYDNPDSADVVPENATLGSESEGKINASAEGGLTFS